MVAPINYALDVASPFTAAAQGMQFGAGIQAMQAQRAELAAKQAQEQDAMRRMQAAEAMRARFFANPNPTMRDAAELAGSLPKDHAEAMLPYIEKMSQEQQQQQLQFGLQTMHALENNPPMGVKLLRDRAATERASGREHQAALFEQFAESAEKSGPQAPFKILAAMVGHLPGAKEAMEIASKGGERQIEDDFRAVMEGVGSEDEMYSRIPGLSKLGPAGIEAAQKFLMHRRLGRDAASKDAEAEAESARAESETMRNYGALRLVFQDKDAFTLQKTGAGNVIVPGGMWSDMQKTAAAVADLPKKKKLLGLDDETVTAIQYLAATDPQAAGKMIAGAISARIKQQLTPAKMSPDALRLTEAGYEYGSPEFRAQMQQEVTAGRTGQAKGAGTTITNVLPSMEKAAGTEAGKLFDVWYESAATGNQQLRDIDLYEREINKAITGPLATVRLKGAQVASLMGLGGEEAVSSTRQLVQGFAEMAVGARGLLKGQGAITENEQKLLMQARSGDISMTPKEMKVLFGAVRRIIKAKTERDTRMLTRAKEKGSETAAMYLEEVQQGAYQQPARPGAIPPAPAKPGQKNITVDY